MRGQLPMFTCATPEGTMTWITEKLHRYWTKGHFYIMTLEENQGIKIITNRHKGN